MAGQVPPQVPPQSAMKKARKKAQCDIAQRYLLDFLEDHSGHEDFLELLVRNPAGTEMRDYRGLKLVTLLSEPTIHPPRPARRAERAGVVVNNHVIGGQNEGVGNSPVIRASIIGASIIGGSIFVVGMIASEKFDGFQEALLTKIDTVKEDLLLEEVVALRRQEELDREEDAPWLTETKQKHGMELLTKKRSERKSRHWIGVYVPEEFLSN